MKKYDSPSCEVDIIEQEKMFLASVETSSDDMPITPVQPFRSKSMGLWEEEEYE